MINCPNCGRPVLEGQKFCGACGADVQAAMHPSSGSVPPGEEQMAPYAYAQSAGYGYETEPPDEKPLGGRMLVIGGALLLAMCCVFACGLVFGFEIIPDVAQFMGFGGGSASPGPKAPTTPTPTSLLLSLRYLIG